ncbi:hypothetical protein M1L60_37140 [Actinoplanes sp. TRM 88003]|uniref:Uncharacterized protein n=1 Tax=Paractinoplanes aksuensis TaxID=2939490 RepID=A0ABT1DZB5_9ACTN|nr:hypothetical protein [Actinoplanes aksuensis]MCO8276219.1 hypothetical protein [Actinoplanes aksuensis]
MTAILGRTLAALSIVVATLPIGAAADPTPALSLPRPTGPYSVGTTGLHLTDAGRADPWRPDVRRELMVSLWYPSRPGPGTPAPCTTAAVSARIVAAEGLPLPPDGLTTVATYARRDGPVRPPAGADRRWCCRPGSA